MAYTPYYSGGWQTGEEGGTPITPAALNHMDDGIAGAHLSELVLTSQTVDANGNINTNLDAGNYVVVSARCSTYIVTPWVSGSTTTWWVHLTYLTGGAVSSGTSVGTVRVYYYDL